jgi:hypothetical protein
MAAMGGKWQQWEENGGDGTGGEAWIGMAEMGRKWQKVVDMHDMSWVGSRMPNGMNWHKLAEIIDKSQLFFGWRTPRYAPWLNLAKFGPVWHTMAKLVFVGYHLWIKAL